MWRGYEVALGWYKDLCIEEWIRRGYKNTMQTESYVGAIVMPKWLGREDIHASHRSNLLKKDPDFYGVLGWTEPHDLEYVWPVQ
tara:strand:+ start:320 stop:571 length:252 start_codon:yes stop_codon:yes gene_type:complete